MGKRFLQFVVIVCLFVIPRSQIYSFTIAEDPQYIIMNFSQMNELNWAAPQEEWETQIKPVIMNEIQEMRAVLPSGTEKRRLGWSTLMEYMNFPMDVPQDDSPYIIKMNRIMEICEELDLPVFIPLNGFQWWDELPELYNWWDPDGTRTPAVFFQRQDNPEDFKKRFIAGYNPDNKWNVEWQDYTTPMKLNWRNWGGGGFRLAPPPNIMKHTRSSLTYRNVVDDRFKKIVDTIAAGISRWEEEGKSYLFAGITIGTEVSLNASVTPADEFVPYGYRSIQDLQCEVNESTCGAVLKWSKNDVQSARTAVIQSYFEDFAKTAILAGLPKQRIYTHIWGEAENGQVRFAPYHTGAINIYSRPGISLYGFAKDPLSLFPWQQALKKAGYPEWGGVEFSTDKDASSWRKVIDTTLESNFAPKIIDLYNWGEHKQTPAIPALAEALKREVETRDCVVFEVESENPVYSYGLDTISWSTFSLPDETDSIESQKLVIYPHDIYQFGASEKPNVVELNTTDNYITTDAWEAGMYSWYIERSGCSGSLIRTSTPRVVYKPYSIPKLTKTDQLLIYLNTWFRRFAN